MSLKEYLSNSTTKLNAHFDSWQQAIIYAGGLLEKAGYIQHSYTEHMVELVRQMGPYIVIMPGVALAHARPDGDVEKNSISLVTMKEGVPFGNQDNDPVYALFAIAARSDEEHLVLFQELARFIGQEENIGLLRNAEHFEDIPF